MDLKKLVGPFSPWTSDQKDAWESRQKLLPDFRREIFDSLVLDLDTIKQIISITGPRRVGKSTLLLHLVQYLINERKVEPNRILYYSLDDPSLLRAKASEEDVFEALMLHMCELGKTGPAYLFLDEIQTYERWEQHLKKYYDLQYPVRVVISGSASTPIFKKSRESLLGRVKDYHLLPFSFREVVLFRLTRQSPLLQEVAKIANEGRHVMGMCTKTPEHIGTKNVPIGQMSEDLWKKASLALDQYVVEGGFPEVWSLPSADKKIEYLFDNQVKKVITEDLVLAVEFRKPEQLKRFYISLLEQPGREVNITSLSGELGVNVQQIEKYLPLLEMTDLIRSAGKFRKSSIRVRRGNQKYYLVDVGLRNAVLRIGQEILNDESAMGNYAENLVFNALKKWPGVLQVDYYRERDKEIDFIVHIGRSKYLPVEVKYRNKVADHYPVVGEFTNKFTCTTPIIVTKHKVQYGMRNKLFRLPLIHFLLLFS